MEDMKLKLTKTLFNFLTKDENSIFHAVDKIARNQLRKASRSFYPKDKVLMKIV